jgi:uncharacterized coiled-coil DUF342 family protein
MSAQGGSGRAQPVRAELFDAARARTSPLHWDGEAQAQQELKQLRQQLRGLRDLQICHEDLKATNEALKQEALRLRSSRCVLDEEIGALRASIDAKGRELAQCQGALALQRSKAEDASAQVRLLKRQLVELEEEVRTPTLS